MALNLPAQTVIDRARDLYPIYYVVGEKIEQEQAILLDQPGGNAGPNPSDPPPVRCDHRSQMCIMPPPVLTSFVAVTRSFRL